MVYAYGDRLRGVVRIEFGSTDDVKMLMKPKQVDAQDKSRAQARATGLDNTWALIFLGFDVAEYIFKHLGRTLVHFRIIYCEIFRIRNIRLFS